MSLFSRWRWKREREEMRTGAASGVASREAVAPLTGVDAPGADARARWQTQPAVIPPRPRRIGAGCVTVDLPWVSMVLPGPWERTGNPNAFEYIDPIDEEQLIVMVVPPASALTVEQQRAALSAMIDGRRHAIERLCGQTETEAVEFLPAEYRFAHVRQEIRLFGSHRGRKMQFGFCARSSATLIVVLSMYRYNLSPELAGYEETARGVFDSLRLKTR